MKHLGAIRQGWFVACIVGVVLGPALPNFVVACVVLVGLILLVREKDERYPGLTWPDAGRAYLRAHQWTLTVRLMAFMVGLWCLDRIAEQQVRGVYVACLGVYALLNLALPVRAESGDATAST